MNKLYKINGNPEEFADLDVFHKLSQQFLPFVQKKLEFDKPVGINLVSDPENAKNPLGKTAYYNPGTMEVTVFVDNRHVKDILRSMSHELVHHTQNCRGEFEGGVHTGPGYAQEDGHMRKMEEEAYLKGQMLLRDWEDSNKLKENKAMKITKKTLREMIKEELTLERRAINMLDPKPGEEAEAARMRAASKKQDAKLKPKFDELEREVAALKTQEAPDTGTGIDMADLRKRADKMAAVVARRKKATPVAPAAAEPTIDIADLKKRVGKMGDVVARSNKRKADQKKALAPKDFADSLLPDTEIAKLTKPLPDEEERAVASPELDELQLEEGEGALCEDCGGMHEGACMEEELGKEVSTHDGKPVRQIGSKKPADTHPAYDTPQADRARKGKGKLTVQKEDWTKKNKDQLLFERLVEKWIK